MFLNFYTLPEFYLGINENSECLNNMSVPNQGSHKRVQQFSVETVDYVHFKKRT